MNSLPLSRSDLDRLGKILGMLGSDHDGERAVAALKADALIRERGLTWSVIVNRLKERPSPAHRRHASSTGLRRHQRQALRCLGMDGIWNTAEFDFLNNMARLRRTPSPAQAEWLARLADEARAARAAV